MSSSYVTKKHNSCVQLLNIIVAVKMLNNDWSIREFHHLVPAQYTIIKAQVAQKQCIWLSHVCLNDNGSTKQMYVNTHTKAKHTDNAVTIQLSTAFSRL